MGYGHAFDCKNCPKNSGEEGCPVWWETVWQQPTGETKLVKACGFTQLPLYLVEVVKASNRPAAAVEGMRNETVEGFDRIVKGLGEFTDRLLTRPRQGPNGELGHGGR